MSTKITGTKSTLEVEKYQARKHVLLNATSAQIDNYVDTNVTDLASAKELFKQLIKIIRFGLLND